MAFEFPDDHEQEILSYLQKREGKDFVLRRLRAQLLVGDEITAIVPIYEGKNIIRDDSVEYVANLVVQANGRDGPCVRYVKGIVEELRRLGIDDPAVNELWLILTKSSMRPGAA